MGYVLILAVVPPCAGECRLVRVTGVLIFTNARTCVAPVLLATGPVVRRSPSLPNPAACCHGAQRQAARLRRLVGRPVAPSDIAGMM